MEKETGIDSAKNLVSYSGDWQEKETLKAMEKDYSMDSKMDSLKDSSTGTKMVDEKEKKKVLKKALCLVIC